MSSLSLVFTISLFCHDLFELYLVLCAIYDALYVQIDHTVVVTPLHVLLHEQAA